MPYLRTYYTLYVTTALVNLATTFPSFLASFGNSLASLNPSASTASSRRSNHHHLAPWKYLSYDSQPLIST